MLRSSVGLDLTQPFRGLNLRDPAHELQPGESLKLQNLYWDGFIRIIPGSIKLTPTALMASVRIRGGHRFYPTTGDPQRFVAYNNSIVTVDDAGNTISITTIPIGTTNVYFSTWSITSSVYIVDGSQTLTVSDGATGSIVTGTNIPTPLCPVVPVLDRLLAVTTDGIERTDPRVDNVWSSNSPWATFRPERPGLFTALHPYSVKGTDTIYPGALALQANAYYHITATDFGSDVTSATASLTEDSAITIVDAQVGTSSPKSVITIPGIGTAWFTSDKNVYWIPEGQLTGKYIGDKLFSNGTTKGLESVNSTALASVWMTHFDRKLILGVPMGSSAIPDTQFWLDLRTLQSAVEAPAPVWYGPMNVDTWWCVWREDQQGELRLMAGEGKETSGAFVYTAYQKTLASHWQGATQTYPVCIYQDRHNAFRRGQQSKHVKDFRLTAYMNGGLLRAGVLDLQGNVILEQPVVAYNE